MTCDGPKLSAKMAAALEAFATILAHCKGKPRPRRGSIPCPICQGRIHFTYDGPRAIRVACETPNCVQGLA